MTRSQAPGEPFARCPSGQTAGIVPPRGRRRGQRPRPKSGWSGSD